MIENSRSNDSRYGQNNRYGNMQSAYSRQPNANYDYNDYYNNPDDEPLDNYLAVQDADNITVDKSFGAPADYYYSGN